MFKKSKFTAALAAILCLCMCAALFACKPAADNGDAPYDGPYGIGLTAIGSTTIKAGKTVQLRTSVTGTTNKDVTFKSSDDSVATVSEKGLVTGLKEGSVTIECALVIEPQCKKTIGITVEKAVVPASLEITGTDKTNQWVGESLQLKAKVLPADASERVTWSVSDEDVATVTDDGLVTFASAGKVTVTAASAEAPEITDSMEFDVNKGVFRSDLGSPFWNVENQCDKTEPRVSLEISEADAGYHSCYFADVSATRYYAEASFRIKKQISAWTWQGVGLGSGLSEQSTRYFIFSPQVEGQGNSHNKFIVKDLPNDSWTAITTRSQTWGENGVNDIDWRNSAVKIALLRDGNRYYYLIDDKLMYVDDATVYDDVATMPILVGIDVNVDVTGFSVITDDAQLDAKLASAAYKTSFYASDKNIISYESNEKFTFKSNQTLSKDNKVKSIGDSAKLVGDFEVEFDIAGMDLNAARETSGITLNLTRYDDADVVESFLLGKSSNQTADGIVAGMYSWDYKKSFDDPSARIYWLESQNAVCADAAQSHRVKVTRTIENNVATFKLYVDGEEIALDNKSTAFVDTTSNYTGAYILWIAGEYAATQVTNLTFSSGM